MNEKLGQLLENLHIDVNLRMRLEKIFAQEEPILHIDLRGYERGKALDVSKEDLPVLLRLCTQIPTLDGLMIVGTKLNDESAMLIANNLTNLRSLTVLSIDGAQIGHEGFVEIAKKLDTLPRLTNISFRGDCITKNTVKIIAEYILQHKQIDALSLHSKFFDISSLNSISKLLKKNQLHQLSISCGKMDNEMCESLGTELAENKSLQVFALQATKIENIQIILDGIRMNLSLIDFMLYADNFDDAMAAKIDQEVEAIANLHKQNPQEIVLNILATMMLSLRQRFGIQTHCLDSVYLSNVLNFMQQNSKLITSMETSHKSETQPCKISEEKKIEIDSPRWRIS